MRSLVTIFRNWSAAAGFAAGALTAAAAAPDHVGPDFAFLNQHCLNCHNTEEKEGGLDLESLAFSPREPANFAHWVKVHDKVARGEMPPKKRSRPEPAALKAFLTKLGGELTTADATRQRIEGRARVRRLNRVEFEHTLSDLFEVPLSIRGTLPPDAQGAGFDTVGAALNVSAVQMESYLESLDQVFDRVTVLHERPERRVRRLSYLETFGIMQENRRTNPFHILPDGVAMFAPDKYSHFNSVLDHYTVPYTARYRVKVSAYTIRSETPQTLTVRTGGSGHQESDAVPKKLLGNVSVQPGTPQVFEFDEFLDRGQFFRIYPSSMRAMRFVSPKWEGRQKEYQGPGIVVQWVEVDGPIYDAWPPASHRRLFGDISLAPLPGATPNVDPNSHLDEPPTNIAKPKMTRLPKADSKTGNAVVYDPKQGVGGEPIYRRATPPSPLRRTFQLTPRDPKADAARLLADFVPAALRRPVAPAEVEPFVALVYRWLDEGVNFETALRAGYKAVLTSPAFLYLAATTTDATQPLDDNAFAERLAYFLWTSAPDRALRARADSGTLTSREVLRAEVERMLADPRAERFIESFLGQWLDLRLIDFTAPDSDLYPEFDPLLQWSLVQETHGFFRELLTADLSVRNIIDSDFAMLNDRLARHYGIPGVHGIDLRRVELPSDSRRGGVLTHGSILKVSANGTTTSPVIRGKWVLERILGTPPDPVPPGVPAIEPDIRGATTIREQLDLHRTLGSCSSCHAKIDPPGMALESFDVTGAWRDRYRVLDATKADTSRVFLPAPAPVQKWTWGSPVDASDVLADGAKFRDIDEFKRLLLRDPDAIVRCVVEKLLTYGTGAPVSFADRIEVERIVAGGRAHDGFRTLVHEVVASELFRRK